MILFIRFISLLLLISSVLFANQQNSKFWMSEIEIALENRSLAFQRIGIKENSTSLNLLETTKKETILTRIELSPDSQSVWQCFIRGILSIDNNVLLSDSLFSASIKNAQTDPGSTWLLFIEFTRYKQDSFADSSLMQLFKQLTDAGADASGAITAQLKNHALLYENQNNFQQASKMYTWMEKFDPDQTWSQKRKFSHAFPLDISEMKTAVFTYVKIFNYSWFCQASHFIDFYTWVRTALAILMFSIFILVIIKYFPAAIHSIADLYPLSVSSTIRTILASCTIIATSIFSIYLFLWITAFLAWEHIDKKDKPLFILALILLLLAPIDARILDMSNSIQDTDSVITEYHESVSEVSSDDFSEHFKLKYSEFKENPLFLLSASVSFYKKGNLHYAQYFIDQALKYAPTDPSILVMAGNIAYQNELYNKAIQFYLKSINIKNRDVSALYNLGQCYLLQSETIKGTEYLDLAAKENGHIVNAFVQLNDALYSKSIPQIRKLMIPQYTPSYFWKNIFPKNNGTWESTNRRWGTTFLGFNAVVSFILFIFIFLSLLFMPLIKEPTRIRKLFECKFCGRISCKKCAHGILCTSCDNQIAFITTNKKLDKIRMVISQTYTFRRDLRNTILGIILPGSQRFLNSSTSSAPSVFLITTSIVYALYVTFIKNFGNNHSSVEVIILIVLFIYNLAFMIQGGRDIQKLVKTNSSSKNQL